MIELQVNIHNQVVLSLTAMVDEEEARTKATLEVVGKRAPDTQPLLGRKLLTDGERAFW